MTISSVTKRNGDVVPFDVNKFNRWAEYAAEVGGNWSEIAIETYKALNEGISTQDIHQTMTDVCVNKATLEHSRIASRLEFATIRKNMQYVFGLDDRASIKDILQAYEDFDVWDSDYIPPYNPIWEDWYTELKQTRLEYWQVKQWTDKYACKVDEVVVETPHLGYFGISLALFGDTDKARKYMLALVQGKVNLPTPALNGLRNGDWDTISCCVISGGDTTKSIGVANHIAYEMTAKKAGIGIELTTRTKGDKVKNGRVEHLGLHPLYKQINGNVKALTQITRGGNATITVQAINPEVMDVFQWKSPLTDFETRIDKLDYSFAYNRAFVDAVMKDTDWYMFSYGDAPELYKSFYKDDTEVFNKQVAKLLKKGVKHKVLKAREILKKFLTIRQETGRVYDIDVTRANQHTPFEDTIVQSNLCMEIQLPTKPYVSMDDLLSNNSKGETAFCSLSGIVVGKVSDEEYEEIAELVLEAIDIMIDRAPMMTKAMKKDILERRSVGVGIVGLAVDLYNNNLDFDGSNASVERVAYVAERHYYYLLKASQKLAETSGISVKGIKQDWLPIDTAVNKPQLNFDWEALRGKPRKHSVLVAHMPTESSSLLSNTPNGLYAPRQRIVTKKSRKGLVQFICQEFIEGKHLTAWDVDTVHMSEYYGVVQDFTDQAISCDSWVVPENYPDDKVPLSTLMKQWIAHVKFGNKTKYYVNTRPKRAKTIHSDVSVETEEDGCVSCKL